MTEFTVTPIGMTPIGMTPIGMTPIGIVRSPYREKFGIPRQPGLAPHALARLVLQPPYASADAVQGLQGFSHLWLLFHFHACAEQGWRDKVRPPRLGGNDSIGVFASRSMFRPNPVGLSLVELVAIETGPAGVELLLRGADLLDGTPVLDIKPYLPWADSAPGARAGYAPEPPAVLPVQWSELARQQAVGLTATARALIEDVLAQDPRPAYRTAQADGREYGVRLGEHNVRFVVQNGVVTITAVQSP